MAVTLDQLRLAVLIAVALIYAIFDLYNKRNVPDMFAYVTVAIGVLFTLTYGSLSIIIYSLLLALAIGAISYVLYRDGQLGAGDGFEFVALSLLLPLQPDAILATTNQFALPFILSVFVSTGVLAIWVMLIYYILLQGRHHTPLKTTNDGLLMGAGIILAYAVLALFIYAFLKLTLAGLIVIALIALPSAVIAAYSKSINGRMICNVYPKELEQGDIIATNLMKRNDLAFFIKKSKNFGRLSTASLMKDLDGVKKRIPVYKRAMPLAAVVFFGVIISVLFGNPILFIIGNL